MAFHQIQTNSALAAPTRDTCPQSASDAWEILRDLRSARRQYGLKDRAITLLQALISLLPKDNPRTRIFASNKTLSDRANGMEERTIRRHISILVRAGLIERHDSANRKRFARRDPDTGELIGYGFDLAPIFNRAQEISALASEAILEAGRIAILRDRLSQIRQVILEAGNVNSDAEIIRKALRRKLSAAQLQCMIAELTPADSQDPPAPTIILSGDDSQIDRHIQKSITEDLDSDSAMIATLGTGQQNPADVSPPKRREDNRNLNTCDHGQATSQSDDLEIRLDQVKAACPEIMCFATAPVTRWHDMDRLGRSVGRMAGIAEDVLDQTEHKFGKTGLALTVAAVLQMGSRIKNHGAYIRSLVSGKHADTFDPAKLIIRLIHAQKVAVG